MSYNYSNLDVPNLHLRFRGDCANHSALVGLVTGIAAIISTVISLKYSVFCAIVLENMRDR
jgi:hypothetical protein